MNAKCQACTKRETCIVPAEVRELPEQAMALFELGMIYAMKLLGDAVTAAELKEHRN